jgi:hypothetical protein
MKALSAGLAALLFAGVAAAQSLALPGERFAQAAQVFQRAQQGAKDQIEPAIAAFEALVTSAPQHPVYAAYLGAATSLKGRDAWMPWDKMRFTEQGLDHVDRALAALKPEHDRLLVRGVAASLETRLVAANLFIALPEGVFHRRAAGQRLLEELQRHPAFAAAPAPFRAAVERAARAARGPGS